jgi:antirestriction protein ArdC
MSVYDIVTERLTSMIEKGNIPWRKPWSECAGTMPANAISHRPYHGLNHFWLESIREDKQYPLNLWLTYKQASELGGQVRKGEKGAMVIFWKFLDATTDTGEKDTIPMLRYYTVFNVAQCDNLEGKYKIPAPVPPLPQSSVYDNMPNHPALKHAGGRAFYRPSEDFVNMPEAKFAQDNEYFSVLYHELSHSTGHASRLARFTPKDNHDFGSADYSREELVAEMASAFVCAATATDNDQTMINSAAYIQSWLGALKNDKTMLVYAASRAQKAADYILGKLNGHDTPDDGAPITGDKGGDKGGDTTPPAPEPVTPSPVVVAPEPTPEIVKPAPVKVTVKRSTKSRKTTAPACHGYTAGEIEAVCNRVRSWGMETWLASERNPKNTPPPLEYQFTGELGERNKITVKSWEAANNLCLYLEGVGIWGNGYDRVVQ